MKSLWYEGDVTEIMEGLTGLDYDDLAGFFRRCDEVAGQWKSLTNEQREREWLILKLNEAVRLMEPGEDQEAAVKVCLLEIWNRTGD